MNRLPGVATPWPAAALILICVIGCAREAAVQPPQSTSAASVAAEHAVETRARFTDLTDEAGLSFVYRNGEEAGHCSILESLGGGVAALDYDRDGRQDLFLPGGGEFGPGPSVLGLAPALYRNLGDWKLQAVTASAGVAEARFYSHGAAAADFNNDGFTDVLITGYGGLLLYRNQGDGCFQEVARASGLLDSLWSSSAAWGDLDGDGNLDLYVAHYADWSFENHPFCPGPTPEQRDVCPPRFYAPLPDSMYRSRGDGTFADGSSGSGLQGEGKGLGVLMADVDLDGRLDIYVANDTDPNALYRNQGQGEFQDVSLLSGTSLSDSGMPDGSMGVDLGDYNLDGLPDLWVANFERESFALYRNEGNCYFQHVSRLTGVTALGGLFVGWGTVFFDFDRDGDEDLFCSNGHVIRYPTSAPLRQRPLLLENRDGRFTNVAGAAGTYLASPHMGRGAAAVDLDNDGDLDLAVSHTNEPVSVLCNQTVTDHGWVGVELVGRQSNRDGIGALIEIETDAGRQTRQQKGGSSYASTGDRRIYFGLGTSRLQEITIRWPAGTVQTIVNPSAGRVVMAVEQHAADPAQPE